MRPEMCIDTPKLKYTKSHHCLACRTLPEVIVYEVAIGKIFSSWKQQTQLCQKIKSVKMTKSQSCSERLKPPPWVAAAAVFFIYLFSISICLCNTHWLPLGFVLHPLSTWRRCLNGREWLLLVDFRDSTLCQEANTRFLYLFGVT